MHPSPHDKCSQMHNWEHTRGNIWEVAVYNRPHQSQWEKQGDTTRRTQTQAAYDKQARRKGQGKCLRTFLTLATGGGTG